MPPIIEERCRTVANCPWCGVEARVGKAGLKFVLIDRCRHALDVQVSSGALTVTYCPQPPDEDIHWHGWPEEPYR